MSDSDTHELELFLRRLPHESPPDPELEERVVAALRARGLLEPGRRRATPPWRRWGWAAAACLVGALIGWTARAVTAAPTTGGGRVAGERYLLLLSEPEGLRTSQPLEVLVAEYRRWAAGLAARGRLLASERLSDESRRLPAREPPAASAPVHGRPTGFFLVVADGWEEALSIAASCPHLRYGGTITVWRAARRTPGP